MQATYTVLTDRLNQVKEKIAKLNRKAEKLGVPCLTLTVGETFEKEYKHGLYAEFTKVTLDGERVKLNGWSFGAVLSSIETENKEVLTLIACVPGVSVDARFRTVDAGVCEHCGISRRRTETFVVIHDDGTQKQVGRQCLGSFLGAADPHAMVASAQYLIELNDSMAGFGGSGGSQTGYEMMEYLAFVAAAIRVDGWVSGGRARETGKTSTAQLAQMVLGVMYGTIEPPNGGLNLELVAKEADKIRAQVAFDFLKAKIEQEKELNDYMYSLSVAMKSRAVFSKLFGIVASIIPTAEREMGFIEERKNVAKSEFFGEVKGKFQGKAVVLGTKELQSQFGVTTMVRFSVGGNVAVWFSSKSIQLEVGKEYELRGSIKAHEEYKGTKQTIMTRCKVS